MEFFELKLEKFDCEKCLKRYYWNDDSSLVPPRNVTSLNSRKVTNHLKNKIFVQCQHFLVLWGLIIAALCVRLKGLYLAGAVSIS